MRKELIWEVFPRVYHMAEKGSWPSIQKHGLLSTSALLDLYGKQGDAREAIEARHRPESVSIETHGFDPAVIRDQKPMSDKGLEKALLDGLKPADWYRILNRKVFFWATEDRLLTLLNAKAYKDKEHDVLTIDTRGLIERYEDRVFLCPYNSGATKPNPFPRGYSAFSRIVDYDFDDWKKKRGGARKALVEICIEGGVEDIKPFVIEVRKMRGSEVLYN